MKHRPFLKRLLLVGVPLGLVVALWAVPRYSPMFEGRRWLRQQSQSAVRMEVESWRWVPIGEVMDERGFTTTDPADIQGMMDILKCVGSLTGHADLPITSPGSSYNYSISLTQANGRKEYLMLQIATISEDGLYQLFHLPSSSRSAKPIGSAQVNSEVCNLFDEAFRELWNKQNLKYRAWWKSDVPPPPPSR